MGPEINKVSNCCGDRLCVKNEDEGTMHYECFACKKPCDAVQDCADCFPQHYPETEYKNKTVPICEKHAQQQYMKKECHCVRTSMYHHRDSNYDNHTPEKCWKENKPIPPQSTDEKIVEIVRFALENHDDVRLLKIAEILRVRAQFEKDLAILNRI